MRDLAALADQIRAVRDAEQRFMRLWRVEQVLLRPDTLDHLADEMAAAHRELDEFADAGCGFDEPAEAFEPVTDFGPSDNFAPPANFGYPRPRIWSMYGIGGAEGAA